MSEEPPDAAERLTDAVRTRVERRQRWLLDGEHSIARNLGQIGALGWMIVAPTLIGLGIGRWLDHKFGTQIFWTAPMLLVGLALGCWSGWRWVSRQ